MKRLLRALLEAEDNILSRPESTPRVMGKVTALFEKASTEELQGVANFSAFSEIILDEARRIIFDRNCEEIIRRQSEEVVYILSADSFSGQLSGSIESLKRQQDMKVEFIEGKTKVRISYKIK